MSLSDGKCASVSVWTSLRKCFLVSTSHCLLFCYVSQEKIICLYLNVSFSLYSVSQEVFLSLLCLSGKVHLSHSQCLSLSLSLCSVSQEKFICLYLNVSVSLYSLKLMVVATKRQSTLPKFQNHKKDIENEQLYLKSWNSFRPWSFLVGGYEGCIGPSGKLFVYDKSQNFMHHTHGTIPYLFGPYDWSVCSSPSTKEIHVLAVRFILVFSSCNIICGIRTYDLGFSVHYL